MQLMIKQSWLNWRKLIVDDRELSFGAKSIALYLNTYMNDSHDMAWPSIATICGEMNLTNKTAIKYIRELSEIGYLEKQRRFSNSTIYFATVPSSVNSTLMEGLHHRSVNSTPTVVETLHSNKQKNKQSNKQVPAKAGRFSIDDEITAKYMLTILFDMNPQMKLPTIDSWSNTIRLMKERDGRAHDEIRELFLWANKDDFWHQNILSPEKLRKQWDTLVVQRKAKMNGGRNLSLPRIDEELTGFAQKNNLSKANPGESYPQYRGRLNAEIEKRAG